MTNFKSLNQGQLYQSFDFRKKNKKNEKNIKGKAEKTKNSFFSFKEGMSDGRAPLCKESGDNKQKEACWCGVEPNDGPPNVPKDGYCWKKFGDSKPTPQTRPMTFCKGRNINGNSEKIVGMGNDAKAPCGDNTNLECGIVNGVCKAGDEEILNDRLRVENEKANQLTGPDNVNTLKLKTQQLWGIYEEDNGDKKTCWVDGSYTNWKDSLGKAKAFNDISANSVKLGAKCTVLPSGKFSNKSGKIFKDGTEYFYITKYGYAKPVEEDWTGCSGLSVEDYGGSGKEKKDFLKPNRRNLK